VDQLRHPEWAEHLQATIHSWRQVEFWQHDALSKCNTSFKQSDWIRFALPLRPCTRKSNQASVWKIQTKWKTIYSLIEYFCGFWSKCTAHDGRKLRPILGRIEVLDCTGHELKYVWHPNDWAWNMWRYWSWSRTLCKVGVACNFPPLRKVCRPNSTIWFGRAISFMGQKCNVLTVTVFLVAIYLPIHSFNWRRILLRPCANTFPRDWWSLRRYREVLHLCQRHYGDTSSSIERHLYKVVLSKWKLGINVRLWRNNWSGFGFRGQAYLAICLKAGRGNANCSSDARQSNNIQW